MQIKNPAEALNLLSRTVMRDFTQDDWYGFSGCESEKPMIGECPDKEFVVVLDGACLNIIHKDDGYGGTLFELVGRN